MRAGQYAFLATFAIFLLVNANMFVWTYFNFSQHLIRTGFQTAPTCFTITGPDPYIFCCSMTPKRIMEFHLSFLLTTVA